MCPHQKNKEKRKKRKRNGNCFVVDCPSAMNFLITGWINVLYLMCAKCPVNSLQEFKRVIELVIATVKGVPGTMLRVLYALSHNSCSQGTYHLVEEAKHWVAAACQRSKGDTLLGESEKGSPVLLVPIGYGELKCPGDCLHSLVACWFVILCIIIILGLPILRQQEQVLIAPHIQQIVSAPKIFIHNSNNDDINEK